MATTPSNFSRDSKGRFSPGPSNFKPFRNEKGQFVTGGQQLTEEEVKQQNLNVLGTLRKTLKGRGKKLLGSGDALRWYRGAISSLGKNVSPTMLLADPNIKHIAEAFIGKMFFYQYDPKWKKTLPYYDTFPLIIPVEIYGDGWLGLNLHYLPPAERAVLLEKLLDFATDKKMDKKTSLQVSYAFLKGVAKFKEATPCVKRYLSDHVRSEVLQVDAPDWMTAIYLPVERFKKKPKTYVWSKR